MRQILFRGAFTVLPIIFGMALPYIGPGYGPEGRFLNLFWSAIFGLGFYAAGFVAPIYSHVAPLDWWATTAALFGFLGWPILLTIALYLTSGRLWRWGSKIQICVGLMLLATSLSIIVPLPSACSVLPWLPSYWCIMFVIY